MAFVPSHRLLRAAALAIAGCAVLAACKDEDLVGTPIQCGVNNPVSRLVVSPSSGTIFVRQPARASDTLQIRATAFGRTNAVRTDVPVRFTSSDSSVAIVNEQGVVQGLKPGTATISVRSCDKTERVTVTVVSAIATIEVTPRSLTAVAGDTVPVSARAIDQLGRPIPDVKFTFSVSDPTVARVEQTSDTTARVILLKTGTVRVIATAEGISSADQGQSAGGDITALSRSFLQIDAGGDIVCGRISLGRGYCWGLANVGQIASRGDSVCFPDVAIIVADSSEGTGEGALRCTLLPKRWSQDIQAAQVSAGDSLGCAVSVQSRGYCWGDNTWGQLGNGSTTNTVFTLTTVYTSLPFSSITAGGRHACALSGTRAYCWGEDAFGQLGDARTINSTTPIPVVNVPSSTPIAFTQISAGYRHTCGVAVGGVAYCWGDNRQGQVGGGAAGGFQDSPTPVSGGLAFAAVTAGDSSHTCGLTAGGQAYCWGDNAFGQLGNGTTGAPSATPVAVSGGLSFTQISAGRDYTCALTAGGAIWCWGRNNYAQLGNGPFSTGDATRLSAVPAQVVSTPVIENPSLPPSGPLTFTSVSAGRRHACATASDGNSYCWGGNIFGALGNQLQAAVRGVPVRVGVPR